MSNVIEEIDRLKEELDALRPLPSDVLGRIEQKLRIESNYHSNAVEGNSLTLGETRSLILHGLTAHGKPMRDHLDIEGHDEAVKAMEDAVKRNELLNEVFIRNLHKVLLKEPYDNDAITPDGQPVKRRIAIGEYKTQPNNVQTSTGEIYYFTPPDQVKSAMSDLIDWYRRQEDEGEHPIVIATTFHYRFIRIHPFDDGNGRMARLLMNMILVKHGYTVAVVPVEERGQYIGMLEQADKTEDLAEFITYIAHCCKYALNLHLKAARGEDIEDVEDIDKEIAIFKRSLEKSTGNAIKAREYADQVLYPFFSYCKEKVERFSDLFESVHTSGSFNVRGVDNQISSFSISEEKRDTWPESALSIDISIKFDLLAFQGKHNDDFVLQIKNEADADECFWDFDGYFKSILFKPAKIYTGQGLKEIKKMFNELIRDMMKVLSEQSNI
ncbi:MAG: Fic family protein [Gemmatimonadetes bacterium]|nr:Fic family protein [Gemmatimonadota bacterium]MYK51298.1 Fic family protein [Gemmatimonadota bacterium]